MHREVFRVVGPEQDAVPDFVHRAHCGEGGTQIPGYKKKSRTVGVHQVPAQVFRKLRRNGKHRNSQIQERRAAGNHPKGIPAETHDQRPDAGLSDDGIQFGRKRGQVPVGNGDAGIPDQRRRVGIPFKIPELTHGRFPPLFPALFFSAQDPARSDRNRLSWFPGP